MRLGAVLSTPVLHACADLVMPSPTNTHTHSADDYFQKSGEFTAWLLEERGKVSVCVGGQ